MSLLRLHLGAADVKKLLWSFDSVSGESKGEAVVCRRLGRQADVAAGEGGLPESKLLGAGLRALADFVYATTLRK